MTSLSRSCLFVVFAVLHVQSLWADATKISPKARNGGLVFVRMADQKFNSADALPAFSASFAGGRSELRSAVVADLKKRAERSWSKLEAEVDRLTAAGMVREIERRWLVNGFLATTTGPGVEALSDLESVAYVYRVGNSELAPKAQSAWTPPTRPRRTAFVVPPKSAVGWNVQAIGAFNCWTREEVTGKGVVIAVADDGLFPTPSLTAALWTNDDELPNGEDDDGNGYVDDIHGFRFANGSGDIFNAADGPMHGTACAGIMVGQPSGAKKLTTGIAPEARVMPLVDGGLMLRLEYAIENGADVFSMSFSMQGASPERRSLYRTALEHATACGLICVGGAGNYRQSAAGRTQIFLPKDVPAVIAAGGVMRDQSLAIFSSEGPVTWSGVPFYDDFPEEEPLIKPDVVAFPADYPVWSTATDAKKRRGAKVVSRLDDGAVLMVGKRGNSFSGPHAAGVIALMLDANPELTPWRVKSILEETAIDLGPRGRDKSFGAGRISGLAAVRKAKEAAEN